MGRGSPSPEMAKLLSVSPHALPARSLPPEPRWKVARKLKEISFQQTALWQIELYLAHAEGASPVHFVFPTIKNTQSSKSQTGEQVGPSGFSPQLDKEALVARATE